MKCDSFGGKCAIVHAVLCAKTLSLVDDMITVNKDDRRSDRNEFYSS